MPKFKFVALVRLAIMAIDFSDFEIFWGCGAYLGCVTFGTFCLATSVSCGGHSD